MFFFRLEMAEDFQRQAFDQVQVFLGGNAPAAVAHALDEKDVIGIEMRAHAAASYGIAHHQVIQPRARDEGELFQ